MFSSTSIISNSRVPLLMTRAPIISKVMEMAVIMRYPCSSLTLIIRVPSPKDHQDHKPLLERIEAVLSLVRFQTKERGDADPMPPQLMDCAKAATCL
jgi:hypothetical protein